MLAMNVSVLRTALRSGAWLAAILALSFGSTALAGPMGVQTGSDLSGWNNAPCSGHGHHDFGRCICDPNWTGPECNGSPKAGACGDHGKSSNGWCLCDPGWKGSVCQTPPACAHGAGSLGKCVCAAGWAGVACDKRAG